MTLKDKLLVDLKNIQNPAMLNQLFEFLQLLKGGYLNLQESNKTAVFAFAGILSDEEALAIKMDTDTEFSHLEGEW